MCGINSSINSLVVIPTEKAVALSIQQKTSIETDDVVKTELPQEVQKAFERLRMSISERD